WVLDSIQSRDVSSCDKRKTEEIVEISKAACHFS
ncbi:uncharacterized protein METZ01_LOCUS92724, partial [marine metagenome]